jgi:hypothetical protein
MFGQSEEIATSERIFLRTEHPTAKIPSKRRESPAKIFTPHASASEGGKRGKKAGNSCTLANPGDMPILMNSLPFPFLLFVYALSLSYYNNSNY